MSIEQKFTHHPLSTQDYFNLFSASPRTYCQITQPEECKQTNLSPEQNQACTQIFQACRKFAEDFECWHRAN